MLAGLTRLPSIGKSASNGVDYTSELLSVLVFLFLWRLSLASLLVVPLSPSIICFVPSFFNIMISMLVLLVSFSLYEFFYFVFQGPSIFCIVRVIMMVSVVFGFV